MNTLATILLSILSLCLANRPTVGAEAGPAPRQPAAPALAGPLFALSLEVAPYWNGPEAPSLKKLSTSHPVVWTWWAKDLEAVAGLNMEQIQRAAALASDMQTIVGAITTREPFDRDKVLARVAPVGKERTIRGKTFLVGDNMGVAICVVNDRTFLLAPPPIMERFLDRPGAAADVNALASPEAAAEDRPLLAIAFAPAALGPGVERLGPGIKPYLPVLAAKSLRLTFEADKALRVRLRAEFPSEETARQASPAIRKAIEQLDWYFGVAAQEIPKFAEREQPKYKGAKDLATAWQAMVDASRAAFKQAESQQSGKWVETVIQIKTDRPVSTFLLLTCMLPRAAKK